MVRLWAGLHLPAHLPLHFAMSAGAHLAMPDCGVSAAAGSAMVAAVSAASDKRIALVFI
jgi:hypothetical protein